MAGDSGVNVKMGVTALDQFKRDMDTAKRSVSNYSDALKENESRLKLNGDQEQYLKDKAKILSDQLDAQRKVVDRAKKALEQMQKDGVDPASKKFQDMEKKVIQAQTGLNNIQADLNEVRDAAEGVSKKTEELNTSLSGLDSISLDGLLSGVGKVTDFMENAAKKVVSIADSIFNTVARAASWADDENTLAAMFDIDVETLQRMQGTSRTIDTTVEAIIKSRQKLKMAMTSSSEDVQEAFSKLGIQTFDQELGQYREWSEVFWEAGEALAAYTDEVERDAFAQRIFGRSWMELGPLFKAGQKEYEKTMEDQSIVTEENVNKLNALDDALQKVDQDYQAARNTLLAQLAPAMETIAGAVSDLLREFNAYLDTAEGQEKLQALSDAAQSLFDGLSDVDFGTVVDAASRALAQITEALTWVKDNHKAVEDAIRGIADAYVKLKVFEIAGTVAKGAMALGNLMGIGGSAAGGAAAAGGASAAAAVGSALPAWLQYASIGAAGKVASEADARIGMGLLGAATKKAEQDAGYITGPDGTRYKIVESDTSAEDLFAASLAKSHPVDFLNRIIHPRLEAAMEAFDGENLEEYFKDAVRPILQFAGQSLGITDEANIGNVADTFLAQWTQALGDENWDGSAKTILDGLRWALASNGAVLMVQVQPVVTDEAIENLQSQLKGVSVPTSFGGGGGPAVNRPKTMNYIHANGLPFVPFDGYIAALHKGERVVPANRNSTYTANSNLYVESMYMNSGVDAQGLAAAMAAENRRIRKGFGS